MTNYLCAHERVILIFNKHQNKTGVSAITVRHESTCIILFLTRYNESWRDQVKSNSLDIDVIHGDIHGRSC